MSKHLEAGDLKATNTVGDMKMNDQGYVEGSAFTTSKEDGKVYIFKGARVYSHYNAQHPVFIRRVHGYASVYNSLLTEPLINIITRRTQPKIGNPEHYLKVTVNE